jgi:hypothetical protein
MSFGMKQNESLLKMKLMPSPLGIQYSDTH